METRLCKYCGEVKTWIYWKRKTDGSKVRLYKDVNGSPWNAAKCPDCNKKAQTKRQRLKKLKDLPL